MNKQPPDPQSILVFCTLLVTGWLTNSAAKNRRDSRGQHLGTPHGVGGCNGVEGSNHANDCAEEAEQRADRGDSVKQP